MAFINCWQPEIGVVQIDTEDIDLLVQYLPLATLDGYVQADASILAEMKTDDPLRPWLEDRLKTHTMARDIKEKTIYEGARKIKPLLMPPRIIEKEIIKEAKRQTTEDNNRVDITERFFSRLP